MQNIITKGSTAHWVFSLYERRTEEDSDQLFHLTNPTTNEEKTFINNTNLSDDKRRYDKFLIEETDPMNEDLLSGKIDLGLEGDWRYEIYEQPKGSTSINVDSAYDNILERGFIKVVGATEDTTKRYDPEDDTKSSYK